MLSRLRLITFDVTDTLIKFRQSPGYKYGEIGALFGVFGDKHALAENFKKQWYKMNKEHPNFGRYSGIGWEKWWRMIVINTYKNSGINVNNENKLDDVATYLIDAYKTTACWQLTYGAKDLLNYLKENNVTLGVISNFDQRLYEILKNLKVSEYFKFVLTSYDAGYEKPNPQIFTEAMKQAKISQLKPNEILHIGDTVPLDYFGPRNVGWHSVVIHDTDPKLLEEKYPNLNPEHVFRSLYEFHLFLKNGKDL